MNLFSDMDDYQDKEGSMFSHWLEDEVPEGHPESAWKDDGDMRLFKEEE